MTTVNRLLQSAVLMFTFLRSAAVQAQEPVTAPQKLSGKFDTSRSEEAKKEKLARAQKFSSSPHPGLIQLPEIKTLEDARRILRNDIMISADKKTATVGEAVMEFYRLHSDQFQLAPWINNPVVPELVRYGGNLNTFIEKVYNDPTASVLAVVFQQKLPGRLDISTGAGADNFSFQPLPSLPGDDDQYRDITLKNAHGVYMPHIVAHTVNFERFSESSGVDFSGGEIREVKIRGARVAGLTMRDVLVHRIDVEGEVGYLSLYATPEMDRRSQEKGYDDYPVSLQVIGNTYLGNLAIINRKTDLHVEDGSNVVAAVLVASEIDQEQVNPYRMPLGIALGMSWDKAFLDRLATNFDWVVRTKDLLAHAVSMQNPNNNRYADVFSVYAALNAIVYDPAVRAKVVERENRIFGKDSKTVTIDQAWLNNAAAVLKNLDTAWPTEAALAKQGTMDPACPAQLAIGSRGNPACMEQPTVRRDFN